MEKREVLNIVGGDTNCCSCYEKEDGVSSKKQKIETTVYNPAYPSSGIYLKEVKTLT